MVDIMYEDYEKKMAREEREKEREKDDAPSTASNVHSALSSYSHHSNEHIR